MIINGDKSIQMMVLYFFFFFESFSLDTIITDKMMMVESPGLSLCGFFLEVFGNWFQISLLNDEPQLGE